MDQMIDHSTIEGTSIERASELRRRRPISRTWLVGAAAALALLFTYLGSSYYRNGQATAPQAAVPSVTVTSTPDPEPGLVTSTRVRSSAAFIMNTARRSIQKGQPRGLRGNP